MNGLLEQAKHLYENGYDLVELPENWYVHGRHGRDNLDGLVIQCSRSWQIADQYAGRNGSVWVVRPNERTRIMDVRNEETNRMIRESLREDYEAGYLPVELDATLRWVEDWDDVTFNPRDIVDSAEWFDEPRFVEWLWEKFEPDMVITTNGAVVINLENVDLARVR